MKVKDTKISIAGVFRCCLEGPRNLDLEQEVEPGHYVPCPHNKTCYGMTLNDKGIYIAAWTLLKEEDND
jgi:hypothetical protein